MASRSAWRYVRPRSMRESTGTPSSRGALLDRLEQRQALRALAWQRHVERHLHRHAGQEDRDQRGVLGEREPQGGVERAPRERVAGEREQDALGARCASCRRAGAGRAYEARQSTATPSASAMMMAISAGVIRRSSVVRRLRSATMRRSTPGSSWSSRNGSAGWASRRSALRGFGVPIST